MSELSKEEFLETPIGIYIKDIAFMIDELSNPIESLLDDDVPNDLKSYETRLNNYQSFLKQIFGTEYHFVRYSDCYGLYSYDKKDWLFKINREITIFDKY